MTNREMLIASLKEELDDPASSESFIAYHVACPYIGASRDVSTPCDSASEPPWRWDQIGMCGPCIMDWLDKEVSP